MSNRFPQPRSSDRVTILVATVHGGRAPGGQDAALARVLPFPLLKLDKAAYLCPVPLELDIQSLDPETFDTWRWRLAAEILKPQKLPGDKAVLDPQERVFPLAPEETMFD